MHFATAEFLGADDLAGGGLHQRRAAKKYRALVAHDDGFVAHRRNVCAAGGARAHDHGDLRNAGRRHVGLVEEDAPEVFLVRKYLVLARQVCAARVDQVDTGQPMLLGHALRTQVLLHGDRVIRAALDRRIVADHHALAARDAADAGDDPGARRLVAIHAVGGQRRQLEERGARIEQHFDAIAGQQFAAPHVLGAGRLAAARAPSGPAGCAIPAPAPAWRPGWPRIRHFSYRLWIRAAA